MRLFPDFDDNLRQAFRQETELFFESILREDRSVLDLLRANYTFLNERLAKHYGIPNVYGSRFRRVTFGEDGNARRAAPPGQHSHGDVLRHPHLAGDSRQVDPGQYSRRAAAAAAANRAGAERQHTGRQSSSPCGSAWPSIAPIPPARAAIKLMDPVGFSLENYDAVGRWRTVEEGKPIDASGGLPDGSKFEGVAGLQQALLSRPELFVTTFTEKLLTYALGRGVEYYDAPAVRKIVREARSQGLPVLVGYPGNRQQHAVSDEEITMIITKKALPRRTFLRGMGATLALPLLDAMVPSMTALAATPANPVRRLGFVYIPMGPTSLSGLLRARAASASFRRSCARSPRLSISSPCSPIWS